MSAIKILAKDNWIMYSKVVAKQFGVNAAIVLGAMCTYQSWNNDQEFTRAQPEITADTCLSAYEIRAAVKVLADNGLLTVVSKGLPKQNYYQVVDDKLLKILTTGSENFTPLDVKNFDDYIVNNKITNPYTNNNSNKNKEKENKYNVEIVEIIDYLNEKLGTEYRAKSRVNRECITARLNEGFTVDDFKKVIDNKYEDWGGTEMELYLRPQTLFGTKFETYLNASTGKRKSKVEKPTTGIWLG